MFLVMYTGSDGGKDPGSPGSDAEPPDAAPDMAWSCKKSIMSNALPRRA
jgi:hypothetical protein